jgi:translocation and assembly module TamA
LTDKVFKTRGSFPWGQAGGNRKRASSVLLSEKKCLGYLNGILCFGFIIVIFFVPLCLNAESPVQIIIEGVKDGELENVRIALTLPAGLVEDGIVNEKWFERFIEQIPQKTGEALEPFGFYDPKVTVLSALKDKDAREIRVLIDPGLPVRVAGVRVGIEGLGKKEAALVDLAASFPMSKGAILRQDIYESAKKDIRAKASELGYLDADFSTHAISIIPEELKGEIDLILDTGPLYYFGDIHFSGASQYPESFFARYMEFKTGDIFSYDRIGLTQRNLINADRFEEVMIHTDKTTAEDHRVPVEISLTPSKPKRLKFGIGYETDIGPKGTIKYEDVNFLGTSHKFESRLDISDPLQVVGVRYTDPCCQ